MKQRTAFLGIIAGILAIGDALFLFLNMGESSALSRYQWIANMPELEKAQLASPELLASSEHVDPRLHTWFAFEEEPFSTFPKLASECRIGRYLIVFGTEFWPDNFYFTELDDGQIACLSKKLPAGHRISKLNKPLSTAEIKTPVFDLE